MSTELNQNLTFASLGEDVQKAFKDRQATHLRLPSGIDLYKFTGYRVYCNPLDGRFSPWWAPLYPISGTTDLGLDGHIAEAKRLNMPMLLYARKAFAVMFQWNTLGDLQLGMAKCVRIRLKQPVWAFGGLCAEMTEDIDNMVKNRTVIGQLSEKDSAMPIPVWHGGAYQLYIPNLTSAHVVPFREYLIS